SRDIDNLRNRVSSTNITLAVAHVYLALGHFKATEWKQSKHILQIVILLPKGSLHESAYGAHSSHVQQLPRYLLITIWRAAVNVNTLRAVTERST
ncbi:hypothetical protein J6590_091139, partial [Homalodisca vitripennis]